MPALTSLAVNDGEATPVAHTFVPQGLQGNVARLKESDGTPIGDNILTISLRNTDTKYKGRAVLAMPVVVDETINGVVVPKVVRTAYAEVNFTFDQTSTEQERTNILVMLGNMISLPGVNLFPGTFRKLENIY